MLGPLLVLQDGAEVANLPAGQRVVLGLLALAHGTPLRRDTLVEALWDEGDAPATALAIIHTYVSRLRLVLDRNGRGVRGRLPASNGMGYRLMVTDDELDLLVFRRSLDEARKARATGDLERACEAYEGALKLWRGTPLADILILQDHPAVVGLDRERAAAVLEYADVASGNGWHDRVLPHLRMLTEDNPLDEVAHARLLIALAGTGRQADALAEYEHARQRLDEELGVLPGPALREAHARVLRQEVPAQARAQAPVDSWLPTFQLPAAPADFSGRESERAHLIKAISCDGRPGVPVLAICGAPGVGKTSLALYASHMLRDRFPDGQLWVQLAGASSRPRDPGDILGELLRALGVPGPAVSDNYAERAVMYRSRLAGRRVLVVADDAVSAAQVRPLIPGTAGCALVVTSRARLEGLDGAQLMPLDVMSAAEAGGMLASIVGPDRVAAEPAAVESLVQVCGSLPLALRIAGARLAARPSWPVSAMVRRIMRKQDRLGELEAGDLSVRASIASSYGTLAERPRRAFRLLAMLGPADFAEWVIAALLGESDAADVVSELTCRSLLTPLGVDGTGEPRYRLHDLLREFAAECLEDEPRAVRDGAAQRILNGWLQLAQMADGRLPTEPYFPPPVPQPSSGAVPAAEAERLTADPIAWFMAERVNLLAAVERACETDRLDRALQLASHQCAYQHLQDRRDAERLWRMIADTADRSAGQEGVAAYARLRIGASMAEGGQAVDAFTILDQCIEQARQMPAELPQTLAFALYWRAACAWDMDDFATVKERTREGIQVARRIQSRHAEFINLRLHGISLARLGHPAEAMAACERAVAIAVSFDESLYEMAALHSLAFACTLTGQFERAISLSKRRLELCQGVGNLRAEAHVLDVIGDACDGLGEHEQAIELRLKVIPVFRDYQTRRHFALSLMKLGCSYEQLGQYPEAIANLKESLAILTQLRFPHKTELARQALQRCEQALLTDASLPELDGAPGAPVGCAGVAPGE